MSKNFIQRLRSGRGFSYYHDGEQITDKEQLAYFKSLGIPPAWQDVKIAKGRRARVQATGIDKAGRLQYIYHPAFRARQEKEKFERTLRFARALPQMRATIMRDLRGYNLDKRKVLAAIVRLMDEAYFRVGNEVYARQNQSYGLTTLRSKHTTVRGDTIIFNFTGKSGKQHSKKVHDAKLARIVRQLDELPGYEIFKYFDDEGNLQDIDSSDVNTYIKETMGEEFSAKDFRTWGGTLLASAELANLERAKSIKERQKAVTACVRKVASRLGNTPAIARSSYIDPRVIKAYIESDDLSEMRRTVKEIDEKNSLSTDERCVLRLLERSA